jgi:hypothetical protein
MASRGSSALWPFSRGTSGIQPWAVQRSSGRRLASRRRSLSRAERADAGGEGQGQDEEGLPGEPGRGAGAGAIPAKGPLMAIGGDDPRR